MSRTWHGIADNKVVKFLEVASIKSIVLWLFLIFVTTSKVGLGCANENNEELTADDLSWVKSSKKIYAISENGSLYKTSFSSNKVDVISDHGFIYQGRFLISSNGRYIVYGSTLKDESRQVLYLYDTVKETDIQIFETPKFDSIKIQFSPDNKELALLNVSSPHRQEPSNEGVYIINLENQKKRFIAYPPNAEIPQLKVYGSELQWAMDGKHVFLAFNGRLDAGHLRAYHKLNIAKASFIEVQGEYDLANGSGYHFIEDGAKVKTYNAAYLQGQRRFRERFYLGKKLHASIDENYNLVIKSSDGSTTNIAKGSYNSCEGITISILGWIEGANYLVYKNKGVVYIYGVAEEKQSLLFNPRGARFGWHGE